MKLQKVTFDKAADALVTGAEASVGFAGSNAGVKAVDSLVKNKWVSKGIVAGLGLLGSVALPNKHLKAVSAGVLGKQFWDGIKEVATPHVPQTGVLADALEIETTTVAPASGAMGALNRALNARRGMGNAIEPSHFRMGNPTANNLENNFVLG